MVDFQPDVFAITCGYATEPTPELVTLEDGKATCEFANFAYLTGMELAGYAYRWFFLRSRVFLGAGITTVRLATGFLGGQRRMSASHQLLPMRCR